MKQMLRKKETNEEGNGKEMRRPKKEIWKQKGKQTKTGNRCNSYWTNFPCSKHGQNRK
jgi:hypothetical protein